MRLRNLIMSVESPPCFNGVVRYRTANAWRDRWCSPRGGVHVHLSQRSPQHGRARRFAALRAACPAPRACSAALPREVGDRFVCASALCIRVLFCVSVVPGCSSSDLLWLHVQETPVPIHGRGGLRRAWLQLKRQRKCTIMFADLPRQPTK